MNRLRRLSPILVVLAGCSGKSTTQAPTINSFTATPASIAPGGSSTLSWSVGGASTISIDNGVGPQTGTSVTVTPSATTTYTLTAAGSGGSVTATATVTVRVAAPVINAFSASPSSVAAGNSSTLSWSVSGSVTRLQIDPGAVDVTGKTSAQATPTATTTYTLTAIGPGGSATAMATVTVTTAPPVIGSFLASPPSVLAGSPSTLSWTVSGTIDRLQIDPGAIAVTGTTSTQVRPTATTTYRLTAQGPGGTATATVTVEVHAPGLRLAYSDPLAGQGKLRLVLNSASTATHLILDLKVGASPLALFGVALNIPLDAAQVSFAGSTSTSLGGLIPNTSALNPGSAPPTAAARIVGASGPPQLRNVFILGLAKKKAAVGDGDATLNPGDTVLQIAFDMAGTAPAPVWRASAVVADKRFKAKAVKRDGSNAALEADFALGDLSLAP